MMCKPGREWGGKNNKNFTYLKNYKIFVKICIFIKIYSIFIKPFLNEFLNILYINHIGSFI